MEVYTYDEEDQTFDLYFRDDFDYFDESRWRKSHKLGFNENTATFFEEQVYVQDGNLVLQLDHLDLIETYYEDQEDEEEL